MLLKIFTQISLAAFLFVSTLAATPMGVAAQPSSVPGSKIIGIILDRSTRAPLAGEVGVSFVAAGKIIFKHAKATREGAFTIEDIEPGTVHLTTKLDGYAAEHQSVSLRQGETKTLELSLVKPTPLRGIVRDPAGRPLSGARVRVHYRADIPERGEITATYQWETGEAKSDARGAFVLDVHPEKEFVVEAFHPDFLRTFSAPGQMKALGKEPAINLALDTGVNLSGIVKDANGNPIQGAEVRLIETGARRDLSGFVSHAFLEQQLRFSSSGADGAFRFDQVSPTTKMVVIIHPGYKPFRQAINVTPNKAQAPFRAVLEPQN
jgi:Carboxypeptidase regulatory-like domain